MATDPKSATEESKFDTFEDDDVFEEFEINAADITVKSHQGSPKSTSTEEEKEKTQPWEDDWDDDDVNDDFSLQLKNELENNAQKS